MDRVEKRGKSAFLVLLGLMASRVTKEKEDHQDMVLVVLALLVLLAPPEQKERQVIRESVEILVPQADILRALLDFLAFLERLARREIKELTDCLLKVQTELRDSPAHPDHQGRSMKTVILKKDLQALQDLQGCKERWDRKVIKAKHAQYALISGPRVYLVLRGQRVSKVFLDKQGVKERRVCQDLLGLLEIPVKMALQV